MDTKARRVSLSRIHCMTGLTLSYKNQWGVVPDTMRLRRHYVFDDAIVAINRALRPAVLADGTFFLDRSGPMEGDPVPMGLILGATDPGAFITWFGYESWFGRGPLHTLLYTIAGKPVKPKPEDPSDEIRA
jgi:hypothetical protein